MARGLERGRGGDRRETLTGNILLDLLVENPPRARRKGRATGGTCDAIGVGMGSARAGRTDMRVRRNGCCERLNRRARRSDLLDEDEVVVGQLDLVASGCPLRKRQQI